MIIASFSELVSIGAVIPFLVILTNPEKIIELYIIGEIISKITNGEINKIVILTSLSFIVLILMAATIRIILLWLSTHLTFKVGREIGLKVFETCLNQKYEYQIKKNSSQIINSVTNQTEAVIYNIIRPILIIMSSGTMMITILAALLLYNPLVTIIILLIFLILYTTLIKITRKKIKVNSEIITINKTGRIKILQESLSAVKDIILNNTQRKFINKFSGADEKLRKAQSENLIIAESPRIIVESIGMIMLILLAIILALQYEKTSQVLPIIGVIALAAQRLLPMMQITYQSYVTLKASMVSLIEIIGILETPVMPEKNKENKIKFKKDIVIENLKYKYDESSNFIIDKFNITIKKGEKIGIKGATGSGKSTLQDIILGLLTPTEGQLKIDGIKICENNVKNWQELITHVPQNTFLIDSSIEDNIAFNSNDADINKIRIKEVAKIAQISEDIEKMPSKYDTIVGERGIYLSGGQCQRIGIARALYKNSEILILDEATSALDIDTEKKVMKAIYKLHEKMTIVIIAHRLSTLEDCDKIIEIK